MYLRLNNTQKMIPSKNGFYECLGQYKCAPGDINPVSVIVHVLQGNRSIYLSTIYLSIYLPIFLPIYLSN